MVMVPGSTSLPEIFRAAPPAAWGTSAPTITQGSALVRPPKIHFRIDFLGGGIGTTLTATTEPVFGSTGGTIDYQAGAAGTQGMHPNPSGAGNAFLPGFPGTETVWSQYGRITFSSSTAATGIYRIFQLRSGTTLVSDLSLRNSTVTPGTREMAFRNSSNATVAGQTTGDPLTAGSTWRYQWDMNNGNSVVSVWKDYTSTGLPDYQWQQTGLSAAGPYNMIVGPDASTGVDAVISKVYADDGTNPAPLLGAGTVTWAMNGHSTASSVTVKAWMSGVTSARLKYSVNSDMSSASFTTAAAPDSDGYQTFSVTGLSANTIYYWVVEADGVLWPSLAGQTNTLKPAGSPQSFVVGIGSCHDTTNSAVFANEVAKGIDLKIQAGDLGYPHAASAVYGNPAPADTALLRTARNATLSYTASPGLRDLYAVKPLDQMYSDGDGGGGNADGTFVGLAGGNVQAAWRQQFAHRTLPLSDCGARSWVIGRVRIILTDETTLASDKTATDNSSKTKLGATQKAWFKAEVDAAKAAGQYILWVGDGPWIEQSSPGAGNNSWWFYQTEKAEVAAYITAAGMAARISRAHGDTHTLFADDGTNNSAGGFPTFSCAPMHTSAQAFGGTVSHGKFPASGPVNNSRQYGIVTVTDDGTTLSLAYKGYSSTNAAPTETNPVSMTVTWVTTPAAGTATINVAATGAAAAPVTGAAAVTVTATGNTGAPVGGTATVPVTASGSIAGAAAGTASVPVTASGTVRGSAVGTATVAVTATGGGQAGATGTASVAVTATGSVGAPVTGSATVPVTATGGVQAAAIGTAAVAVTANGAATVTAGGSATIPVTATGTTGAPSTGSATVVVTATGSARGSAAGSATIPVTASGAGAGALTGSATIPVSAAGAATAPGGAAGTATVTVIANGTAGARATGSATIPVTASGSGATITTGTGQVTVVATGGAGAPIGGSATIPVTATGSGRAPVVGAASVVVSATGAARGAAAGSVTIPVTATGNAAAPGAAAGTATVVVTATGTGRATAGGSATIPVAASGAGRVPVTGNATVAVTGNGATTANPLGSATVPVTALGVLAARAAGEAFVTLTALGIGVGTNPGGYRDVTVDSITEVRGRAGTVIDRPRTVSIIDRSEHQ